MSKSHFPGSPRLLRQYVY